MSCGNPHDLDCGEALAHLYEFIDGEIGPVDRDLIAAHLDECGPCLDEFDIERIVKVVVRRSCGDVAPGALRARIIEQVSRVQGAFGPRGLSDPNGGQPGFGQPGFSGPGFGGRGSPPSAR